MGMTASATLTKSRAQHPHPPDEATLRDPSVRGAVTVVALACRPWCWTVTTQVCAAVPLTPMYTR